MVNWLLFDVYNFIINNLFTVFNLGLFIYGVWACRKSPNFVSIFLILLSFTTIDLILRKLILNTLFSDYLYDYSYLWGAPLIANWIVCCHVLKNREKYGWIFVNTFHSVIKKLNIDAINSKSFFYLPIDAEKFLIKFYYLWIAFMCLEGVEQYGYLNISSQWAQALINGITINNIVIQYQFDEIYSTARTIKRFFMVLESTICLWLSGQVYLAYKKLRKQNKV